MARCFAAAENFMRSCRKWPILAAPWTRPFAAAAAGLVFISTHTADVPAATFKPDPRIGRLEKFFKIYHCPAPHSTFEYLRAADGYGLDYRLLPAVSIRETQCGVTERQRNNRWG